MEERFFEERFSEEVIEIAAITGTTGTRAGRAEGNILMHAHIDLIAWKGLSPTEPVNHNKVFRLAWLVDDEQWQMSKDILQPNRVVRLHVRKGQMVMMLIKVLDSEYKDNELEAILEASSKPAFYYDEVLGEFKLYRVVNWFEKTIAWAGEEGQLSFYRDEEEKMKSALQAAYILFGDQEKWSRKIRAFAAQELVSAVNDLFEEGEEITEETFMKLMVFSSILIQPDGGFEMYFSDGDMFYGHSIIVSGNVNGTIESAVVAG
ncbi:conserved hypothetical membrane spanning protein [Paenibacillus curdlanolyticus YK9]|uniref:Conserved hypothetical membrane spanning protein n=1 Tax=Paenibacillus curdlanolyticus YK9 TaxID=717606 RepID=E0I6W3_9BACL|nr:conserved hypothetical membrane spanning protein [Paenibacillus curdlanolyticus YK9]